MLWSPASSAAPPFSDSVFWHLTQRFRYIPRSVQHGAGGGGGGGGRGLRQPRPSTAAAGRRPPRAESPHCLYYYKCPHQPHCWDSASSWQWWGAPHPCCKPYTGDGSQRAALGAPGGLGAVGSADGGLWVVVGPCCLGQQQGRPDLSTGRHEAAARVLCVCVCVCVC